MTLCSTCTLSVFKNQSIVDYSATRLANKARGMLTFMYDFYIFLFIL